MDWRQKALCGEKPHLFFSDEPEEKQEAVSICMQCPVRRQCMEWAIEVKDNGMGIYGTWGGATEDELRHDFRITETGEPTTYDTQPGCPYCKATSVNKVDTRRSKYQVECSNCHLSWWIRRMH